MSCTDACRRPTPAQAHCGTCHVTFGGVTGFDAHRRAGQCRPPDEVGYTDDGTGVFRAPLPADAKVRLTKAWRAQAAEKGSGVHGCTPRPENADLAPTERVPS